MAKIPIENGRKVADMTSVTAANATVNMILHDVNGMKKISYWNVVSPEPREIPFTPAEIHEKTLAGDFTELRVGDYKTVTMTTGEVVEMQIAGINVYKNYGNTELGNHIIWLSRDCLAQKYKMRTSDTNNGTANEKNPFRASELFSTLQNTVFPTIPAEWRSIIGNMRCTYGERYSSSGSVTADTNWAFKDRGRLFLPTPQEVFGNNGWSENYECCGGGLNIPWPIFFGGNVIKRLGRSNSRCSWWLCTARAGDSTRFCNVSHTGGSDWYASTTELGVPLCFITI